MGAFLSVGKGSSEPSVFLEMKYSGAKTKDSSPLVFVGKGKSSWNPACFKVNAFSYPVPFTKLGKWVTGLYFMHFLKAYIYHKDFAVFGQLCAKEIFLLSIMMEVSNVIREQ